MTASYHIKKIIYTIIFITVPFIGISDFRNNTFATILSVAAIIFLIINCIIWGTDTLAWNKGNCQICGGAWIRSESDAEGTHEFKCRCGRRILL